MTTKATTWKQAAAEAIKAGYQVGNPWERMLERHLFRCFPKKVADLQQTRDMHPYTIVHVWRAMKQAEAMEAQGTDPETA